MNDKTLELLSIGDATYDTFLAPSEMEALCDINNQESLICFTYGDKIPVKQIDFSVGGNAANNAVGVSRLGINAAIITKMGTDLVGETILHRLSTEKVDVSYVEKEKTLPSNASTVITYSGERTIFTYHSPYHYELPTDFPRASWVYLTSMGDNYEQFYRDVMKKVTETGAKLAINPGSRQLRGEPALLLETVKASSLVYINMEEARRIVGLTSEDAKTMSVKELLTSLSQMGPETVLITDGSNGSYAFDGKVFLQCGVMPVDAYERTGAGDAFGSGSLSALIKGKTLKEALLWGTVNSASVIGYTGAQRGLLHEADIYDWLDRADSSEVLVKEI